MLRLHSVTLIHFTSLPTPASIYIRDTFALPKKGRAFRSGQNSAILFNFLHILPSFFSSHSFSSTLFLDRTGLLLHHTSTTWHSHFSMTETFERASERAHSLRLRTTSFTRLLFYILLFYNYRPRDGCRSFQLNTSMIGHSIKQGSKQALVFMAFSHYVCQLLHSERPTKAAFGSQSVSG